MAIKTDEELLTQVKMDLIKRDDSVFISTVAFSLKHIFDDKIPTACTNGRYVKYGTEFFRKCTREERLAVMLHEVWHVVFDHCSPETRSKGKDQRIWNYACDYVINYMLVQSGHKFMQKYLYDAKYKGMSADQVYKLLMENPPPNAPNFMGNDIEPSPGTTEENKERLDGILIKAATMAKMNNQAGTIPGSIQVKIDGLVNPILPWDRIVQRWVKTKVAKDDFSFTRPNRRYMNTGLILPSAYSLKIEGIGAAIDMSGSVQDEETIQFISEVAHVLTKIKVSKVSLVQFDTTVFAVDEVKSKDQLLKIDFRGRGGTDIDPAMQWTLDNKPSVMVVFTDGYFTPSTIDPKVPVLWVIYDNPSFTAPFGEVVHYKAKK